MTGSALHEAAALVAGASRGVGRGRPAWPARGRHSTGRTWGSVMIDALGLEPGIVRLVEYDTRWPALFAEERRRLREACHPVPLELEHVGGTSIPGMCAKPVMDIAAGRGPHTPVEDCVASLRRAGYEHRGERGVPGRQFFCRGNPRAYHVHLVEDGGPLWLDLLAFRDYLRAHAEAANRVAALKRDLAARYAGDREGYVRAKSAVVEDVLRMAGRRMPR